jgi:hypothetical protein
MLGDRWVIVGVVLADRPRRLFHTLGDPGGGPSVHVTWELRSVEHATFIRLYLPEPGPYVGTTASRSRLAAGPLPAGVAPRRRPPARHYTGETPMPARQNA